MVDVNTNNTSDIDLTNVPTDQLQKTVDSYLNNKNSTIKTSTNDNNNKDENQVSNTNNTNNTSDIDLTNVPTDQLQKTVDNYLKYSPSLTTENQEPPKPILNRIGDAYNEYKEIPDITVGGKRYFGGPNDPTTHKTTEGTTPNITGQFSYHVPTVQQRLDFKNPNEDTSLRNLEKTPEDIQKIRQITDPAEINRIYLDVPQSALYFTPEQFDILTKYKGENDHLFEGMGTGILKGIHNLPSVLGSMLHGVAKAGSNSNINSVLDKLSNAISGSDPSNDVTKIARDIYSTLSSVGGEFATIPKDVGNIVQALYNPSHNQYFNKTKHAVGLSSQAQYEASQRYAYLDDVIDRLHEAEYENPMSEVGEDIHQGAGMIGEYGKQAINSVLRYLLPATHPAQQAINQSKTNATGELTPTQQFSNYQEQYVKDLTNPKNIEQADWWNSQIPAYDEDISNATSLLPLSNTWNIATYALTGGLGVVLGPIMRSVFGKAVFRGFKQATHYPFTNYGINASRIVNDFAGIPANSLLRKIIDIHKSPYRIAEMIKAAKYSIPSLIAGYFIFDYLGFKNLMYLTPLAIPALAKPMLDKLWDLAQKATYTIGDITYRSMLDYLGNNPESAKLWRLLFGNGIGGHISRTINGIKSAVVHGIGHATMATFLGVVGNKDQRAIKENISNVIALGVASRLITGSMTIPSFFNERKNSTHDVNMSMFRIFKAMGETNFNNINNMINTHVESMIKKAQEYTKVAEEIHKNDPNNPIYEELYKNAKSNQAYLTTPNQDQRSIINANILAQFHDIINNNLGLYKEFGGRKIDFLHYSDMALKLSELHYTSAEIDDAMKNKSFVYLDPNRHPELKEPSVIFNIENILKKADDNSTGIAQTFNNAIGRMILGFPDYQRALKGTIDTIFGHHDPITEKFHQGLINPNDYAEFIEKEKFKGWPVAAKTAFYNKHKLVDENNVIKPIEVMKHFIPIIIQDLSSHNHVDSNFHGVYDGLHNITELLNTHIGEIQLHKYNHILSKAYDISKQGIKSYAPYEVLNDGINYRNSTRTPYEVNSDDFKARPQILSNRIHNFSKSYIIPVLTDNNTKQSFTYDKTGKKIPITVTELAGDIQITHEGTDKEVDLKDIQEFTHTGQEDESKQFIPSINELYHEEEPVDVKHYHLFDYNPKTHTLSFQRAIEHKNGVPIFQDTSLQKYQQDHINHGNALVLKLSHVVSSPELQNILENDDGSHSIGPLHDSQIKAIKEFAENILPLEMKYRILTIDKAIKNREQWKLMVNNLVSGTINKMSLVAHETSYNPTSWGISQKGYPYVKGPSTSRLKDKVSQVHNRDTKQIKTFSTKAVASEAFTNFLNNPDPFLDTSEFQGESNINDLDLKAQRDIHQKNLQEFTDKYSEDKTRDLSKEEINELYKTYQSDLSKLINNNKIYGDNNRLIEDKIQDLNNKIDKKQDQLDFFKKAYYYKLIGDKYTDDNHPDTGLFSSHRLASISSLIKILDATYIAYHPATIEHILENTNFLLHHKNLDIIKAENKSLNDNYNNTLQNIQESFTKKHTDINKEPEPKTTKKGKNKPTTPEPTQEQQTPPPTQTPTPQAEPILKTDIEQPTGKKHTNRSGRKPGSKNIVQGKKRTGKNKPKTPETTQKTEQKTETTPTPKTKRKVNKPPTDEKPPPQ